MPSSSPVLNFAVGLDGPPALVNHAHVAGLTGSWTPAASMAEPRAFYSATLLDDGRVLVAGGFVRTNGVGPPVGGHYTTLAQLYDPHSDSWETTGQLATARAGHGEVLLRDGRVLIAGGQTVLAPGRPPISLSSAEIYDPETGAWTATGSMNVRRLEPILTLLPDGRVFVSGAARTVGPDAKSAEIYDPATGHWTRVADMSTPRNDHIQVLLDDPGDGEGEKSHGKSQREEKEDRGKGQGEGRILVAGGFRDTVVAPGAYFASAEIYDVQTNTWTPTGSMNIVRADAEGVLLKDGRVLATGGNTAISRPATRTNTAEIYDSDTGQWTLTGGAMSEPKVDHAIALLKDGEVLVAGGVKSNDTEVASADIYNPRTDTWTPVPSMSRARGGIFAVTLRNGRVLVVGGLNEDPNTLPDNALASAEIFVPARGAGDRRGHDDGESRTGATQDADLRPSLAIRGDFHVGAGVWHPSNDTRASAPSGARNRIEAGTRGLDLGRVDRFFAATARDDRADAWFRLPAAVWHGVEDGWAELTGSQGILWDGK